MIPSDSSRMMLKCLNSTKRKARKLSFGKKLYTMLLILSLNILVALKLSKNFSENQLMSPSLNKSTLQQLKEYLKGFLSLDTNLTLFSLKNLI